MLKYCVDQWEKNKENLREAFKKQQVGGDYEAFGRIVIENIFPEWRDYKLDAHYYGDYQGDVVYFIHSAEDSCHDLFLSLLSYGSCSVCDSLLNAEDIGEVEGDDARVHDLMELALHFIQNMTHPYYHPWTAMYDECCR